MAVHAPRKGGWSCTCVNSDSTEFQSVPSCGSAYRSERAAFNTRLRRRQLAGDWRCASTNSIAWTSV